MGRTKKERLGKAALAKSNTVQTNVDNTYEDDRQKFNAASQSFGITYDSNNNVDVNQAENGINQNKVDISNLQTTANTVNNGGTTADRPTTPINYQMYFDTDLNKPIWYSGTDWVDATGTVV